MLNWIGDHWFQLSATVILGVGFVLLISLMHDASRMLEAIRDEIKGLRADVAQAERARPNPDSA
ncbi:MAG: hypothetical protein ACRD9W_05920 [Terriglobia bacterium]